MTDDKLEKEVTEYLNTQTLPKIDDFVYLVIKNLIFGFTEPREKRIEELENKIADIKANCDLAIEGKDVKIMELEEEKEKLQEQIEIERNRKRGIYEFQITQLKEQIEKMKRYLDCEYCEHYTQPCGCKNCNEEIRSDWKLKEIKEK